jgi:trans-aconitate methyltransferase
MHDTALHPSPETLCWDAAAYAANSEIQLTWARELIARLNLQGHERVMDVGCGDGKITEEIAAQLPHGSVTGVDISPQMIDFARAHHPGGTTQNLHFQVMDARALQSSQPLDFVFSNAALHWVNDHEQFLRSAAAILKDGGRLVLSCGGKGNAHDVFLAMRPILRRQRWREFFRNLKMPYFFYPLANYQTWLARANFQVQRLEIVPIDTAYEGTTGFASWLRTTWLPYVQRVPAALRDEFIEAVIRSFVEKHPLDAAGNVHVRMVRLEIEAVKINPAFK